MARRRVTAVSAPAAEPLTLGEAKAWAKIDGNDEDALLAALVTAARESAEEYLRRSLITRSLRLTLDLGGQGFDEWLGEGAYDLPVSALHGGLPDVIELPRGPVQSITSVTTYDLGDDDATFAAGNYRLAGDRLALTYGAQWPSNLRPAQACEIVYAAGYGDTASSVPQSIRTAMLMHLQKMYDGRIVCEMPEGCVRLLRPYRVMDSLAYA